MKKILIFNVNWRGDVLFSTPFIRAVKEKYPQSFLACLVVRRCVPILENNPYLDEIIIFEEKGAHKSLSGKIKLIKQLRGKNFDTVFILHRSFTRALICYLAGIPTRIGYAVKNRRMLLSTAVRHPEEQMHKCRYFLNLAAACGIEDKGLEYDFFPSAEDKQYIEKIFNEKGFKKTDFLVILNPGGNWPLKRWPAENFAELNDKLIRELGAKVIITGAEKDRQLIEQITKKTQNKPIVLAGKTTLGQLAALMARVNLVVANDSGPMHIASSQKTKVIALFGPTNPKITGPSGGGKYVVLQNNTTCSTPCYRLNCPDNKCMRAISVEDVFSAVKKNAFGDNFQR